MSFGTVAADYDRVRPGPPPEAIDWLLPDGCDVVVDLAAGTGLLTRALAGKASRVIAVEPDDRMRAVLESRSGEVEALAGRGEAIPLPGGCADAVLVSSAWHWMNPDLAVPEIARVLRPGGRSASPGPAGQPTSAGCTPTTGSAMPAPSRRRPRRMPARTDARSSGIRRLARQPRVRPHRPRGFRTRRPARSGCLIRRSSTLSRRACSGSAAR